MTASDQAIARLREAARAAARQGGGAARAGWLALAAARPGDPEAANALGNLALAGGVAGEARRWFETALAADSDQPALLFNFAAAARATGDLAAALDALDRALAIDPYFVQAMFQKGVLMEQSGNERDAARVFRDFLDTVPPEVAEDPRFALPLGHAREMVAADDTRLRSQIAVVARAPSRNVGAAIAHLTGAAPLYRAKPTFLTLPELPSIPFLDRAAVPWLGALEAGFTYVRDEALALHTGGAPFVPYVANPPGTPLNQWAGLDHSRDWGAFFLWRHGQADAANQAQMPRTTALLRRLPLLELEGRAPNAFLSLLAPRTRIPPHTGVTNARITVHLPLLVPEGCAFRVGPETRPWREGDAWAFDDTIEHEAWNDSDLPRLILIVDAWHPALKPDERADLKQVLSAYDAHYGRRIDIPSPPSSKERRRETALRPTPNVHQNFAVTPANTCRPSAS